MSAPGLGRVKTKIDLVVMPSGRRIFAFFCSDERGHKPQNFGCVYTAQRFHTAWVTNRLMHRSRRPLGSITKSAASLDVARSLGTATAIGSPRSAGEIRDATAGVHCGARERGCVAGGGAGATVGDAGGWLPQHVFEALLHAITQAGLVRGAINSALIGGRTGIWLTTWSSRW
jgi:hypothetical protein